MARLEVLLKQLALGALYRRGVNSSIGGRVFRSSTTLTLKTLITIIFVVTFEERESCQAMGKRAL